MTAAIRSKSDPLARGRIGDRRLMRQQRRGDRRARELMIERYMPLAGRLALRYRRGTEPIEDLVQVAAVGLVKAVDRWDPDRGLAFSTFAVPTILGELRRHFRDTTWDVRPPRLIQELCLALERAREAAHAETGREPTASDLAGRLGRSREQVEEGLQAADARRLLSLDAPTRDVVATAGEVVGHDDAGYEQAEARATIASLTSVLTERDRKIVRLRYEQDLVQSEIAQHVGCSQMHVSRLLKAALDRMALQARLAA